MHSSSVHRYQIHEGCGSNSIVNISLSLSQCGCRTRMSRTDLKTHTCGPLYVQHHSSRAPRILDGSCSWCIGIDRYRYTVCVKSVRSLGPDSQICVDPPHQTDPCWTLPRWRPFLMMSAFIKRSVLHGVSSASSALAIVG